ncbi:hypothetical protein BsWGS_17894 [Bradybaena similaris]
MFGKQKNSSNASVAAEVDINSTRAHVPTRNQQSTGTTKQDRFRLFTVPKSWFYHFYLVGGLVHIAVFIILIYVLLGNPIPTALRWLMYFINLGMDETDVDNNAWPVVIVFTLELLQMVRRLYECVAVSSFSKSTMSFVHYFYGIFLYTSFGIGFLASVRLDKLVFVTPGSVEVVCSLLGVSLFVWGFCYQHKSMLTFASLRRDKKDHKPDGHYIPQGHLFEMVSSPHYLCEILIYSAMCLVFRFRNIYLLTVALFVWTNQISASILVHTWYKEHFPGYPVTRKAIIPYIL